MRAMALFLVFVSLGALVPSAAAASDGDCVTNAAALVVCTRIDVPFTVSQAPRPTYYLWIGPGECRDPLNHAECRGVPAAPGSTVGVFGLLYEETNHYAGLQRRPINSSGTSYPADKMVLV